MIAALARAATLAPTKNGKKPAPCWGRSAPTVIATAIVPGPVVNGSVNGKNAYFGVNTNDAMTGGMGWVLPPSGSDADFPAGYHPFQALCGNDSTEYTITILGKDGSKVSKKFTVTKKP